MMSDQDIFALVRRLAQSDMSLDEFEDEFVSGAWHDDSQLAREIRAVLAETSGNNADDVAVARLRALLPSQNETIVIEARLGRIGPSLSAMLGSTQTTTYIEGAPVRISMLGSTQATTYIEGTPVRISWPLPPNTPA